MRAILVSTALVLLAGCYGSKGDPSGGGDAGADATAPTGGSCGDTLAMDLTGPARCERIAMPVSVMLCGAHPVAATQLFLTNPAGGRVSVAVSYDATESIGIQRLDDCATCPTFAGGGMGGEASIEPVTVPAAGASFVVTMDPPGPGTIIVCTGGMLPGPP